MNKDVKYKKCGRGSESDPWACYQCTMDNLRANITANAVAPCLSNSVTAPGQNSVHLDFAGSSKFVQTITLVGSYNSNDYAESSSFDICVTSDAGTTCVYEYTSASVDRAGVELKVLKYATLVVIKRTDGEPLGFRHVGVYTTQNDCSGALTWPDWPKTQVHIRDTINVQIYP